MVPVQHTPHYLTVLLAALLRSKVELQHVLDLRDIAGFGLSLKSSEDIVRALFIPASG